MKLRVYSDDILNFDHILFAAIAHDEVNVHCSPAKKVFFPQ